MNLKKIPFVPLYHFVSDEPPVFLTTLYKVFSVKQFQKHLDFYLRYFTPIGLEDFPYLKDKKFRKPPMLLTFDDGFRNFYEVVFPILYAKGIPSAIFVCNDFVEQKQAFYRLKVGAILAQLNDEKWQQHPSLRSFKSIKKCKKYIRSWYQNQKEVLDTCFQDFYPDFDEKNLKDLFMGKDELEKLYKKGVAIGGHSSTHPNFELLSTEEQLNEAKLSMQFVKENFPQSVYAFAFPFSDKGLQREFFQQAEEQGVFDISFGTGGWKKSANPNHYQRLAVESVPKWKSQLSLILKRFL